MLARLPAHRGSAAACPRPAWLRPTFLLLATLLAAPEAARAQTGNVCVRDFQPGAVCTANDVRIQELNLVTLVESCDAGVIGEAEAVFDVFVSAAGSPERYDIGTFVALDGGSARDGDVCFHDYLQPPLTPTPTFGDKNADGIPDVDQGPWLDAEGDACGDITAGTQLFKNTPSLRVVCVDTNANGIVDASVCTSWDNNTGTTCSSLADAFPGTAAKCGCARVELGIPMGTLCGAMTISPATLPPATPGVPYSQALTVTGGIPPHVWSLTPIPGNMLPPGLSLSAGGVISGTPTTSGIFTFSVRVTDQASCFADRPYTLTIGAAVPTLPWFVLLALAAALLAWGYFRLRARPGAVEDGGR